MKTTISFPTTWTPQQISNELSRESQFEVGHGLSSTEIRLIKKTVNN
jgi:hypothetical protein